MHTLFCCFVRNVFNIMIITLSSSIRVQAFFAFYQMSIPMFSGKPSTNVEHINIHKKILLTSVGHNNDIDKKVKKEDVNPNLNAQGFAKTCFGEIPKLLPLVHNCGFTRKKFEDKYDLGFIGLNLRHIKLPRDCTKEEVEKLFGPIVNKNGDCYMECTNPKIFAQVERLWMITHQKPYILFSKVITLS